MGLLFAALLQGTDNQHEFRVANRYHYKFCFANSKAILYFSVEIASILLFVIENCRYHGMVPVRGCLEMCFGHLEENSL